MRAIQPLKAAFVGISIENITYKYLTPQVINSTTLHKKDISTPQSILIVHEAD